MGAPRNSSGMVERLKKRAHSLGRPLVIHRSQNYLKRESIYGVLWDEQEGEGRFGQTYLTREVRRLEGISPCSGRTLLVGKSSQLPWSIHVPVVGVEFGCRATATNT